MRRRSAAIALVLTVCASRVEAQEFVRRDEVVALLSRERVTRDAERVRVCRLRIEDRTARAAERVRCAHDIADVETELRRDLDLGSANGLDVEASAREAWARSTGRSIADVNGGRRYRECASLARALNVTDAHARRCIERGEPSRALPWPLYVPGFVDPASATPSDGADRRLARVGTQIASADYEGALRTLATLEERYETRLARALARWGSGEREAAEASLIALALAHPERGEAWFDLAALLLAPTLDPRPPRDVAIRALAADRMHSCAPQTDRRLREHAAARADTLQFLIERPPNWIGSGRPVRPPVAARGASVSASVREPLIDCARALRRVREVFGPAAPPLPARAVPASVRPVQPPPAAIVASRPLFAWIGGTATLELCDDRACRRVRQRIAGVESPYRAGRRLPAGRMFWRVRTATQTSAVRVAWTDPRARTTAELPDVDGDGWPDVPLAMSGTYARFGPRGPALVELPGTETATADTRYAGDLDGDGYGDFVQSTGYGVLALYGSANGLTPPHELAQAQGVEPAGDIDGDGRADLIYAQSAFALELPLREGATSRFATDLRALGDLDGDGCDDVAVSMTTGGGRPDRWRVFLGGPRGLRPRGRWWRPEHEAKALVVGDVDGDARLDALLVRRSSADEDAVELHRAIVEGFAERLAGRSLAVSSDRSVHVAGDLDRDGFDDVVVHTSDAILVHRGSRDGPSASGRELARWSVDEIVVARVPDGTTWILAPFERSALRVERGDAQRIELAR